MPTRKKRAKRNHYPGCPDKNTPGVEVYPKLRAIEAEKPDGQLYRHDFTSGPPVIGLEDGSLLIPAGRRRLWKMFR